MVYGSKHVCFLTGKLQDGERASRILLVHSCVFGALMCEPMRMPNSQGEASNTSTLWR